MKTAEDTDTDKLLAFIRSHGHTAVARIDGQISALLNYTTRRPDGSIGTGQEWETVPATWSAVRAWLGY